jgi:hypothetical protein
MAWTFDSVNFLRDGQNSSPHIYGLLEQASGISRSLIDAAINGDGSAQLSIQQWADYQRTRAANAATVYNALTAGTEAQATVAEEESRFLMSARESLEKIANAWSANQIADQGIQQSIQTIQIKTAQGLALGAAAHKKALSNLELRHRANLKLLDITAAEQARRISGEVTEAQVKQLPGGGQFLTLGKRLSRWLNRMVEGKRDD